MHLSQAALLALPALAHATITLNTTIETESDTYWSAPLLPSAPVSSACSAAYAREIPCDDWLLRFQGISLGGASYNQTDIDQSLLSGLCTDACIAGLQSYRDGLRSACTPGDKAAAAPALDIASEDAEQGSVGGWDGSERGRYYMAMFLNESRHMTEYLYYMPCMTDLPSGDYCLTLPDDDYYNSGPGIDNTTSPTSPEGQAFCNSTCYTQQYAFMLDIAAPTFPELIDQTDIVNVTQFCPGLDTSEYAFLPQNSGSGSSSSSSSSSSSDSGSASGNSTQEGAAAAVGTGGAVWGLVAVLGAVVVGVNGL